MVNIAASLGVSLNHLRLIAGLLGTLPPGTRVASNRHDVEHQHGSEPSTIALRYRFLMGATKVHDVEVRAFESIHDAREWFWASPRWTRHAKSSRSPPRRLPPRLLACGLEPAPAFAGAIAICRITRSASAGLGDRHQPE